MFHYIRSDITNNLKYLNFFSENNFINFLDSIPLKNFINIKQRELLLNKSSYLNNKILLTFDDGLKEHYNFVFKELLKRNILGVFFVPTKPLTEKSFTLLTVHKSHILYGYLGWDEYIKQFLKLISISLNELDSMIKNKPYKNAYPYDLPLIAKFKYMINFQLDKDSLEKLNDNLISKFIPNKLLKDFYCTEENLQEINRSGMIIGAHGHDHTALSKLNFSGQFNQIKKSEKILRSIINSNISVISYPFGDEFSINEDTIKIVKKLEYKLGFLAENSKENDYLKLPRIDCAELKN